MKYKAIWFDQESVVKIDIVEASSKDEAERKAYIKYNGKGPAPLLSIEEVK